MMLNNLGNELVARGRIDEGIEAYLRGLTIAPNFRKLRENLDEALMKKRGPLRQSPNEANEANEANGAKGELDSNPES